MKKSNRLDLGLVFLWPIIATILSFVFNINIFASVILFLAIPSIYLSLKGKRYWKKAAIFSLGTSIPLMIVIDYIAHLTGTWAILQTIFPIRLFNFVTIEVILWAFFTCFFVIMFYEYFLNMHATNKLWTNKSKYLFIAILTIFITFTLLYLFLPEVLYIPYWYLIFGITLTLIPFLLQLFIYPKTTGKFFLPFVYFFYVNFLWEITAVKLRWWDFPGTKFIGWVSMLGIKFPIEEVLFWFILLALAILSYYEYFDDDEK